MKSKAIYTKELAKLIDFANEFHRAEVYEKIHYPTETKESVMK